MKLFCKDFSSKQKLMIMKTIVCLLGAIQITRYVGWSGGVEVLELFIALCTEKNKNGMSRIGKGGARGAVSSHVTRRMGFKISQKSVTYY